MPKKPKMPKISITVTERNDMPSVLERLRAALAKGAYVKVGMLGGDSKMRGQGEPLTNVDIALVHEFGSLAAKIPERSFLRSTFDMSRAEYETILEKFAGGIYDGKLTVDRALGLLGAKVSADVKGTVVRGEPIPPPNAPRTLALKEAKRAQGSLGPVRTLIDTGRMIGSVAWQVFMGGAEAGPENVAPDSPPSIPFPTPVPRKGKPPPSAKDAARVAAGKLGWERRRAKGGG